MTNSNNTNMDLWNSLCITDPSKVKPITGKSYKGSSPQPYWLVQRATETFGPCGQGWGIEIVQQGFQQCNAETMMHYATVRVWYMQEGKKCSVEHMGGTMAMYKTSTGKMIYDEDAPKKSVTDAMVKALSFIGFAGDIFSGIWDDWKYQEMAAAHYNEQKQQPTQNQNNQNSVQQQKPLAQRYNDALLAIKDAKKPQTLDKAINTFKGTQYEAGISKACRARADQMGWNDAPPINQVQQQNQIQH
ncbi:hypothetical protein [Acinetobacter bereziniae]|uniref:hypothetical protein n=1 Tax=Acinetobacter bereziniae TaxID=106648 RepID=UPI001A44092C|nr:hypothetical protein [Acinetobacter sp.]